MFSNRSKDTTATPAPVMQPTAQQQKRAIRSTSAPSIISADLVVTGTLTSSGDIHIEGKVEGNVNSSNLVIGDKAHIEGDVKAEEVTIRGRVKGAIRARKVLLASTCHVEGDILHEAFAVETGAFFEGSCRHSDNPLASDGRGRPTEVSGARVPETSSASMITMRPVDSALRLSAASFAQVKTSS